MPMNTIPTSMGLPANSKADAATTTSKVAGTASRETDMVSRVDTRESISNTRSNEFTPNLDSGKLDVSS